MQVILENNIPFSLDSKSSFSLLSVKNKIEKLMSKLNEFSSFKNLELLNTTTCSNEELMPTALRKVTSFTKSKNSCYRFGMNVTNNCTVHCKSLF